MYIDYLHPATTTNQNTRLSSVPRNSLRLYLNRIVKSVGAPAVLVLLSPIFLMAAETPKPPVQTIPIRTELRYFSSYNSNFFNASTNKDEVFLHSLGGKIAVDILKRDTSTLTGEFGLAYTFVVGVKDADYLRIEPRLNYKFHGNDLSLRYFYIPRERSSDDPDAAGATKSVNNVGLRFSRRWNRRLRTRLGYQFSHEDFVLSSTLNRNIHKVRGDIRYRFHKLFTPGIGFELGFRRAEAGRSYNQGGPVLLVESRITKKIRADLRYRYRFRDYPTGDSGSSNFGREDHKNDVRLRARYKLTDNWLPFLYFSYKNSDSTRTSRTYDTAEVGLGISFRFP